MSSDITLSSEEMQLVTFTLDNESFGLDIMNVQEIIRIPSITAIPQSPSYVEGITNLRGNILPVIDTRAKFGLARCKRNISNRVIVVDMNGNQVGLCVDAVSEVLRVDGNHIETAPSMVSIADQGSITGVVRVNDGRKLVMVLEASALCNIGQISGRENIPINDTGDLFAANTDKNLQEVQLVSFLLGNEEFALDIEVVREIIRYPAMVKVPNAPSYIRGVISLRDELIPIIDMRIMLGTGSDDISDITRVIVMDIDSIQIGLVVDRVYEVTRIDRDTIFPPPQALTNQACECLQGIAHIDGGKRIIMLIDPHKIMVRHEIQGAGTSETLDTNAAGEETTINEIDEVQMVVFKLAGEEYGVDIIQVQEINRLSQITKIPRVPGFVEGVVNLRGDVIPVIDLRKRFAIEYKEYNEFTRIIVSDINNKKVGIIVDEVLEVLRIPAKLLENAPDIIQTDQSQRFMNGIANLNNRMIMRLDLENILLEKEWQKVSQLGKQTDTLSKVAPKLKKQSKTNK